MVFKHLSKVESINGIGYCLGQKSGTPEQRPEKELPVVVSGIVLYSQHNHCLERGTKIANPLEDRLEIEVPLPFFRGLYSCRNAFTKRS